MTMIYERGGNPALLLHRHWMSVLNATSPTTSPIRRSAYGPERWSITLSNEDSIVYGPYGDWNFKLYADGRFQMWPMRGSFRRNGLTRGTFLGWSWNHGYSWYVDTSPGSPWGYGTIDIHDYQRPVPYVDEFTMGFNQWRTRDYMALKRQGEHWAIILAPNQGEPHGRRRRPKAESVKRWERFERLAAKRHERARRAAEGTTIMSAPPPTVKPETITMLSALLDVSMPAKATPMKRREALEAQR